MGSGIWHIAYVAQRGQIAAFFFHSVHEIVPGSDIAVEFIPANVAAYKMCVAKYRSL